MANEHGSRFKLPWSRSAQRILRREPASTAPEWRETLRSRLLGGKRRAAAIHLSAEVRPGADPRAEIARFRQALDPLDRLVDEALAE